MLLAAPAAAAIAAGLYKPRPTWTPLNLKYTKIMGTMEITPEAYKAVYGGGRGGGNFARLLMETLQKHQEDMNRFYGFHRAAMGDDIGVRG
jgi:hypothetical protein